jgi:hypothetical protein
MSEVENGVSDAELMWPQILGPIAFLPSSAGAAESEVVLGAGLAARADCGSMRKHELSKDGCFCFAATRWICLLVQR